MDVVLLIVSWCKSVWDVAGIPVLVGAVIALWRAGDEIRLLRSQAKVNDSETRKNNAEADSTVAQSAMELAKDLKGRVEQLERIVGEWKAYCVHLLEVIKALNQQLADHGLDPVAVPHAAPGILETPPLSIQPGRRPRRIRSGKESMM